ncbi:MAG: helix-turn-helix domain-containing protein [Chloroflexi bacterium]|nr:MAG: helix-turn-helix domain-containing protein [Chloroflexota bacterium]TMF61434.1 MAG: helix-turn-helix domain-containing protein [Chloroflexota bacterium]TMG39708.1 MAG: helix-turn-helix domain-containing protein [Chloroflexota bacterium]TMG41163.1 MAG: helix-turn-helix domain-containing protein [Chloroflexota bacterium]
MISASRLIRNARRRSGLTQRELAAITHVPQPTIAAIESGRQDPRYFTLAKLLTGCGWEMGVVPMRRRLLLREIQTNLRLTPTERIRANTARVRILLRIHHRRILRQRHHGH